METDGQRVIIEVDGGEMEAHLASPLAEERYPAIIIVHDIFGLRPHIEDVAGRFAREGYIALAPDLFWNSAPPRPLTDRAAFREYRLALDDREILRLLDASLAFLRDQPAVNVARIGILGFCVGGYYAFLEAAANPTLAACVDFYGAPMDHVDRSEKRPRSILEAARELRVPLLGLFGRDDESIPVEQIGTLEEILTETGVPFEFHVYPNAAHAFFNDTTPAYREHAAKEAWPRVLEFLGSHLQR